MLKRLENVLFSVRKASGLYNIEQGKGYRPQRCQMSQELLSETVACSKHSDNGARVKNKVSERAGKNLAGY